MTFWVWESVKILLTIIIMIGCYQLGKKLNEPMESEEIEDGYEL